MRVKECDFFNFFVSIVDLFFWGINEPAGPLVDGFGVCLGFYKLSLSRAKMDTMDDALSLSL